MKLQIYYLKIFIPLIILLSVITSSAQLGLWTSAVELAGKPMSGLPWEKVKAAADAAIYCAVYAIQVRWENQFGGWKAQGDDLWILPFIDDAYGTNWSEGQPERMWEYGKNVGWPYVIWSTEESPITPKITLTDSASNDQDDMCIWIHPSDPPQSTIITSDKSAYKLFVYDLEGNTLQTISLTDKPGNIDIRYGFILGGQQVDIVGYNDRLNARIVLYKVDPATRQLTYSGAFNAGSWPDEIYGFCLYHSPNDGKYYAFGCGKSNQIRQWELVDKDDGTIGGIEKRTWVNGTSDKTEGMVADDETGKLYAANESEGIYKYDADPENPNPSGQLIAATGQDGLVADIEGITIYYAGDGTGYLIVSSQGEDKFNVYNRAAPHEYVKTFTVTGITSTDGIDVTNIKLSDNFPYGVFTLHNGGPAKNPVEVCAYEDLGLIIDTEYWNPRVVAAINKQDNNKTPLEFGLFYNCPNPFNPTTTICYQLPHSAQVQLVIFDVMGQKVFTLADSFQSAGSYSYVWEGVGTESIIFPVVSILQGFKQVRM